MDITDRAFLCVQESVSEVWDLHADPMTGSVVLAVGSPLEEGVGTRRQVAGPETVTGNPSADRLITSQRRTADDFALRTADDRLRAAGRAVVVPSIAASAAGSSQSLQFLRLDGSTH